MTSLTINVPSNAEACLEISDISKKKRIILSPEVDDCCSKEMSNLSVYISFCGLLLRLACLQ